MKSVKETTLGKFTFIYSDLNDHDNLMIAAHTFLTQEAAFKYALSCAKAVTSNRNKFYKVNKDHTIIESYNVVDKTELRPDSLWKIVELGSLCKEE